MGIAAAFSLSGSEGIIKNTYWSHIDFDQYGEVYAGLTTIWADYDNGNVTISGTHSWEDFCQTSEGVDPNGSEDCNSCKDASAGFHITAYTMILSKIGQLATDLTRSKESEDVNLQKMIGLLSGVVGAMSTVAALITYGEQCFSTLPDEALLPTGEILKLTLTKGAGYILTLIITIGAIVDGLVHLAVPCPEECATPGYLEKRSEELGEAEGGAVSANASL